jgi:hypothetical protein
MFGLTAAASPPPATAYKTDEPNDGLDTSISDNESRI